MIKARKAKAGLQAEAYSFRELKDEYFSNNDRSSAVVQEMEIGSPANSGRHNFHGHVAFQELWGTKVQFCMPLCILPSCGSHVARPDLRLGLVDLRIGDSTCGRRSSQRSAPVCAIPPSQRRDSLAATITSVSTCTASLLLACTLFPEEVGASIGKATPKGAAVLLTGALWHLQQRKRGSSAATTKPCTSVHLFHEEGGRAAASAPNSRNNNNKSSNSSNSNSSSDNNSNCNNSNNNNSNNSNSSSSNRSNNNSSSISHSNNNSSSSSHSCDHPVVAQGREGGGGARAVMLHSSWQILMVALSSAYRLSAATLLLSISRAAWAAASSQSFDVASASLALMAVLTDQQQLRKRAATGSLPPGPATEAAWRAFHKRSARKVAHHMKEIYASPPLAPLLSFVDSTSVRMVERQPFGMDGALLGPRGGILSLAISFPMGRRAAPSAQHGAGDIIEAVALCNQPQHAAAASKSHAATAMTSQPSGSSITPFSNFQLSSAPSAQLPGEEPAASYRHQNSDSDKQGLNGSGGKASQAGSGQEGGSVSTSSQARTDSPTVGGSKKNGAVTKNSAARLAHVVSVTATTGGGDSGHLASGSPGTGSGPPAPALYGKADHSYVAAERQLNLSEKGELFIRGLFLLSVFAPFMTLGVALLLLSVLLSRLQQWWQPSHCLTANEAGELLHLKRLHQGTRLFSMVVCCRKSAWLLLLLGCRASGAAMIKWAQWAATRADIFPEDFCEIMSTLHEHAPMHSFRETKKEIESSFGMPLDCLFVDFQKQALASGSIAQVHVAKVRLKDGTTQDVAVKVRHPMVARRIWMDFQVLKPLAAAASCIPALKFANLKQSLSMFSHTMTAQCDMRVEAAHLKRFSDGFSAVRSQVTAPRAIPGMVTESILVETFEKGRSVAHYTRKRTPINTEIVSLGVDTYLGMLLQHNFVHTDLHPGNIMVRMLDGDGNIVTMEAMEEMQAQEQAQPHGAAGGAGAGGGSAGASGALQPHGIGHATKRVPVADLRAQLILLDFGLAEELTPTVRIHFVSFLNMICAGDGKEAARHLLQWSDTQLCPNPSAFTKDIVALFQEWCNVHDREGVDLDRVMKAVLRLASEHEVSIESSYASLVIAVCVLVGFASSLDPEVNIIDAATACLLYYNLSGRVMGRLYG